MIENSRYIAVELHVDSEVVVRNTQARVDCSNVNVYQFYHQTNCCVNILNE